MCRQLGRAFLFHLKARIFLVRRARAVSGKTLGLMLSDSGSGNFESKKVGPARRIGWTYQITNMRARTCTFGLCAQKSSCAGMTSDHQMELGGPVRLARRLAKARHSHGDRMAPF